MAMIRTALALIALALVAQSAAIAEPARPTLRSEAVVTGNVVRIGDLIDHAGIVANIPIFRAPPLGESGTVSASQVLAAVKPHALIGIDPGPIEEITVTRASRTVPARDIQNALAAALGRTSGLGDPADISINFDRALRDWQVEPSSTAAPAIENLRYDAQTGRFDAVAEIPGAPQTRRRLTGSAVATANVVVLTRAVARGDIIGANDLTMQRIPRSQLSGDTIVEMSQAIGRAARGALTNNHPLRTSDVMRPEVVRRNESVALVYRVPGIVLSVRGKAVDSGAEGDMIDVVNVQSNRTVRGTIVGPGQVSVAAMTVIATADARPVSRAVSNRAGGK
jgi:flagella basal body P-ring formation protein FlgA